MNSAGAKLHPGQNPPPRSLAPLWALIVIIGLPILAAVVLNYHTDWLPQERSNRGELITPPVPLADRSLARAGGGAALAVEALHGRWVMLALADSDCGATCQQRAYDLRQIRLATGADRDRVERILVFTAPASAPALAQLRDTYPRLALTVDTAQPDAAPLPLAGPPGAVYLIDPMGNLMMRYAATAPAEDILKDLKRLLRISKEWP